MIHSKSRKRLRKVFLENLNLTLARDDSEPKIFCKDHTASRVSNAWLINYSGEREKEREKKTSI